ncbi:hypothetical protein RclHR1_03260013 [Rhizophagus clarus]|uniref:F-box domain-containing protein n=1 Tax=Rhizophagus clarus TaxID=94130 RepID=A0A2Z6R8K6_9GLOM|nr:hypothetical protein RclHR1_03260013 [Rhizophagus clarus]GES76953.1 hypothetical protein GLOIN_2v1639021 [Rhizophagus clarus]
MASFPNEILQEIFININDIKTLYSIILVNRNWCRNGIKYLWRNPFRGDVDLKNHTKIVPLLLKFIVKDKEFMKRFIRENYDKIMKDSHDEKTEQEIEVKVEDNEKEKEKNKDDIKKIVGNIDIHDDHKDHDDDDNEDSDDNDELDFDEYDDEYYDYDEDDEDDYDEDYEDSDEYYDTDDDDDDCSLPVDISFDYPSFITHIDFHNIFLLVLKYVKNKESKLNNKEATSSNKNNLEKGKGKENIHNDFEIGSLNLDINIPLPDVPEIEQVFGFVFTIMRIIVKRGAIIEKIILHLDENDLFGESSEREPPTSIFHYNYGFDEKVVEQFITRLDMFFISLCAIAYEKKKMTFKKLRNVELSGCTYKNHVLSSLALLSKNVKILGVNDFNLNDLQEPLIKFIKSQKQLEQVRIKGDSLGYIIDKLGNISGVISCLESQANTLKKLKLTNANIGNDPGFESLLKCTQLENLSLVQVNMRLRHLRIFNHASFPNLKTLKLDFIDYSDGLRISNSINPFIKIMNNHNMVSNLNVLSIKYEGENNHKLLKGILENCNKNLSSFSTFIIEKQDIPPLFSILKKCINMKKLSLTRSCRLINFGFTVEMAKILPKSLSTLEFIHMVLSDSSLIGFFDNCKVELKQFRLNFHGDHHLDRVVYRGLIEKYSKEKKMVIKEFDMSPDSAPNLEFNVKWE